MKISLIACFLAMLSLSRAFQIASHSQSAHRFTAVRCMMAKAGVSSPEELKAFIAEAGEKLLVVDVRNPDASVEPGDLKSFAVAQLPSGSYRPQAVSLVWDRDTNQMPLPSVPKETPIITH